MEAAAPPVDMKELVAQVGGYTRKGSKNFSESHPLAFKCLQSLVKANNAIYTAMEEYPLAIYGGVSVVGAAAGCMQGLERGVITSLAGLVGGFVAGLTLVKLANRLIQPRLPLIGEPREHVDRLLKSALVISKQPCFECRRETEQLQDHVLKQYIRYCITQTVLSAPLADRFLYQIRYRGIIVAHLIGTMHITNAAAAQDVTLNNIVRNSCELIVEVAFKEWFIHLINLSHTGVDLELMKTAYKAGVPVTSLESLSFQKSLLVALMQQANPAGGEDISLEEFVDMYRTADSRTMHDKVLNPKETEGSRILRAKRERLRSTMHKVINQRNQYWLGTLIPILEAHSRLSKKPYVIAVGALHCLGKGGLVLDLRKEPGFEVERIRALS